MLYLSRLRRRPKTPVCARNIQGFTLFRKRCESLYIPGPYLMGRKHTRIHTFSNGSKFEKVWILVCFHQSFYDKQSNHLKRCESLYISGPYLMGRELTRIYTFSNDSFSDQIWKGVNPCKFHPNALDWGNIHGFTPFQILIHLKRCESLWIPCP